MGKRFTPYHFTSVGLSKFAERILISSSRATRRVWSSYHSGMPAIIVNSYAGPNGPIRPIAVNGNHRTLAAEALGAPIVLALIQGYPPPYRAVLFHWDDWAETLRFFRWLESEGALRMSPRQVLRNGVETIIRVADTPAPWLLAPPGDAIQALDVYERFWRRRVERIGDLDPRRLKRVWGGVEPTRPRDTPVVEIDATNAVVTFQELLETSREQRPRTSPAETKRRYTER